MTDKERKALELAFDYLNFFQTSGISLTDFEAKWGHSPLRDKVLARLRGALGK